MTASAGLDERSGSMKRSKFSEEQIVYALRQADSGTSIGDLCPQLGIADANLAKIIFLGGLSAIRLAW
jgi:putative transposase